MSSVQSNKTVKIVGHAIRVADKMGQCSIIGEIGSRYLPIEAKILGAKNSFVTLLLVSLFHKFNYAPLENWGRFIECVRYLPSTKLSLKLEKILT